MTLRVVSLPHTRPTATAYSWCAYTEKVRKFADMMPSLGYTVTTHYGLEPETGPTDLPEFSPTSPHFKAMNARVVDELRESASPGDYLCLIGGTAQAPIADAFPWLPCVEFGVGYGGVLDRSFRVFESYAWMHAIYAQRAGACAADGRFFDAVIPNYFESEAFPLGTGDGGYLLYLGRLVDRKGWRLAQDVCERAGLPFVVAGPGSFSGYGEYVGLVGPQERAKLLGDAAAVFCPTLYVEPFCGVHVEAQLCGTPVITTDWGVFPETLTDPRQGRRCRMFSEFTDAATDFLKTPAEREWIRDNAISRWSCDVVKHSYDAFFRRLDTLRGKGFYA